MTHSSSTKRVAIVTGSSRGIGRAVAAALAADDIAIVVNDTKSEEDALSLVKEIEGNGGRVVACRANVALKDEAPALIARAHARFGGLDILINNAGVINIKPLAQFSEDEFDTLMDINLKGTFNMLKLAQDKMRNEGRITNFSSSALATSLPG